MNPQGASSHPIVSRSNAADHVRTAPRHSDSGQEGGRKKRARLRKPRASSHINGVQDRTRLPSTSHTQDTAGGVSERSRSFRSDARSTEDAKRNILRRLTTCCISFGNRTSEWSSRNSGFGGGRGAVVVVRVVETVGAGAADAKRPSCTRGWYFGFLGVARKLIAASFQLTSCICRTLCMQHMPRNLSVIYVYVPRFVQHPEPSLSILSVDGFVANAIAIAAQPWNVIPISTSVYLNRMWRALNYLDNLGRDLLP